jgi:DNA invertase Pin-like site-specific DNA recombinase
MISVSRRQRGYREKHCRNCKYCNVWLTLIPLGLINANVHCKNGICAVMSILGYARVSTHDQALDVQLSELRAAGAVKVYSEKISGAITDRAELAKLLRALREGDVLVVTRLDRLARSTRDLLNVIATLSERGAMFKSLHDTWADTTTPHGRLMLTVLGGLAEFERELIKARTGEGRRRAKDRGVKFGRPPSLTSHQRTEALARIAAGETQADIARSYDVDPANICRLNRGARCQF